MERQYRAAAAASLVRSAARKRRLSLVVSLCLGLATISAVVTLVVVVLNDPPGVALPGFSLSSGEAPSPAEVSTAVKNYLAANAKCSGSVSVNNYRVSGVGSYVPQMDGYPVYGDFSVVCRAGKITTTHNSTGDADSAIAYVKKTITGWQAFTPEIFLQIETEMKGAIEDSMSKLE